MNTTFISTLLFLLSYTKMDAQNTTSRTYALDAKGQSMVAVSACTAKGDMPRLKQALNTGLDAGVTINELKEAIVQLYAYCGFPRSLNGINALMAVLEDRQAKGIRDTEGKAASPVAETSDKYQVGKSTLEKLTKKPEVGAKTGAAAFAPVIDTFLKEHLFADIFSRDVLSYAQRELVTIAALFTLDGVEPQLQVHLGMGLNVGITESQLKEVADIIETNVGRTAADAGKAVLSKVLASRQ